MMVEIITMASIVYVITIFGKKQYEATPNNAQAISMATQCKYLIPSFLFSEIQHSESADQKRHGYERVFCECKRYATYYRTDKAHITFLHSIFTLPFIPTTIVIKFLLLPNHHLSLRSCSFAFSLLFKSILYLIFWFHPKPLFDILFDFCFFFLRHWLVEPALYFMYLVLQ